MWTSTSLRLQTATASYLLLIFSEDSRKSGRGLLKLFQVHKDGHLILLCSRPNCHEKKYAECDERAFVKSCSSNTSWVGGLQKTVDNQAALLEEIEESPVNDKAVIFFYQKDRILSKENPSALSKPEYFREYYSLTIHRYFCGRIPDTPPDWYLRRNWPYWPENQTF
ncbi:unnamed protein product [Angiostrongylus costaricensis]|uniref:Uncharacterized protein n=1 Tax=Angiostrongylus costaricensis TaxID=334426 RepID=A0A3P7JLB7_ANGCS|nr:unnamed protein product [Angiostrongylus costaricensis]